MALSGSYNDLLNPPTIPPAQVNSDWNATSGIAQILNKPTIPAPYVLPPGTTTTIGGVKQGANIQIATDGTISVVGIAGADYSPFANQPSSTSFVYLDGVVSSITEVINGLECVTSYTYNTNGTVHTISTSYNGSTRTETFSYNPDGTVASISALME